MRLAMSRPWKHPKTGVYWLRKRVPDDLRTLVGKREEKRSLQTKDAAEAKERFLVALASLEARWRHLRLGDIQLSETQAHQLASSVYDRWMATWKDRPSEQRSWKTEAGVAAIWDLRPIPDNHIHLLAWYEERLNTQRRAFETADRLLEASGMKVDDASRKRVAVAVTAALQRASLDLEKMSLGPVLRQHSSIPYSTERSRSLTFDEVKDGWAAEKRPTPRTVYEWGRIVEQLKTFVGHNDASRLTSTDLNKWKASLIEAGLQPKTIRDAKLAPIRAVLQWAVDNDKLPSNVASRIVMDVKSKPANSKRSFSEEEATTVLQAAVQEHTPVLRWVPLLCAYTGGRVAEICQLRKEDVLQLDGIWCLRITPDAGPIKNANSERAIPIHSALIDEGFIDFVKKTLPGPLFPQLMPTRFGSRGGNGTKVIGRWVRGLGIKDGRISPNHSWRHRFKTLARRHGLASDMVDAIVGHRRRTVADGYGEFPITALHREIEKIPALSLRLLSDATAV